MSSLAITSTSHPQPQPQPGGQITDTSLSIGLTAASPTWQDIAQRRRDDIKNAIPSSYLVSKDSLATGHNFMNLPETCSILNERELEITSLTATKLLHLIHTEVYTAVEVTTAFCKRAAVAHQAVGLFFPWILLIGGIADCNWTD